MTVTRKWTPTKAKRFVEQSFTDRISWVAARVLLGRVTDDPAYGRLAPDVRDAIERFMERHPKPTE